MRNSSSQHTDSDAALLHVVVQLARVRTSISNLGPSDKDLFGVDANADNIRIERRQDLFSQEGERESQSTISPPFTGNAHRRHTNGKWCGR